MRFIVDDAVFEKLENVCFGVVVAKGIDNVVRKNEIISIKYILPIGAHDIDAVEEDIMVRFSVAGDKFTKQCF